MQMEENEWNVKSQTNPDPTPYNVTLVQPCAIKSCLRCRHCQVCHHMARCTCQHYIRGHACKHIHAIGHFFARTFAQRFPKISREERLAELSILVPSEQRDTQVHWRSHEPRHMRYWQQADTWTKRRKWISSRQLLRHLTLPKHRASLKQLIPLPLGRYFRLIRRLLLSGGR